jgi:integrase
MQSTPFLTPDQLAAILQINEHTLSILVTSGQIPHTCIHTGQDSPLLRFNQSFITGWLNQGAVLKMKDEAYIERLRKRYETQFPEAIAALKAFNAQFTEPRHPKGYNLSKVKNKQLGFAYYVRYIEKGRLVPSRWSTHTNNQEQAVQFAVENRERLLAKYRENKKQKEFSGEIYDVFEGYYKKDSLHLQEDRDRGRILSEDARRIYHNFVTKRWVPYLRDNNIKKFSEIDTPLLARFQNKLLRDGVKPQTINHYTSYVSQIFDHLVIEGGVSCNPFNNLNALKITGDSYKVRGCYDVNELRGVFNKRWKDNLSYLLCLVIYSTGMRNGEIERIQVKDIIKIEKRGFIDIPKSKTKNGVRIVPLHDFVYNKLIRYINKTGKGPEDLLFGPRQSEVYNAAASAMGALLKYDKATLERENITFYSGRHFWKTLMNSENLGDVEEYFMGHKVSNDVAKRYNHRDKQGKKMVVKKAGEVSAILDKRLFGKK